MKKQKIEVGSTVEYRSVSGKKRVPVLEVKEDGNLILDTKKLGLCKNVCVKPHRVTLVVTKPKTKKSR